MTEEKKNYKCRYCKDQGLCDICGQNIKLSKFRKQKIDYPNWMKKRQECTDKVEIYY